MLCMISPVGALEGLLLCEFKAYAVKSGQCTFRAKLPVSERPFKAKLQSSDTHVKRGLSLSESSAARILQPCSRHWLQPRLPNMYPNELIVTLTLLHSVIRGMILRGNLCRGHPYRRFPVAEKRLNRELA